MSVRARLPWLLVLGVVGALLPAASARAFLCTRANTADGNGPSLFWQPRAVSVQLSTRVSDSGGARDVDAAAVHAALDRSVEPWNAVGCADLTLEVGADTDDTLVGFDWRSGAGSPQNHNIVVFRNGDPADPLDAWVHAAGALAITTVTYESSQGRLLDADIEVNDAGFEFSACEPTDCTVDFDLQNTLTHELGHVAGLDHPTDHPEATMAPSATRGDVDKRTLAQDDEDGLCTIYPGGETAPGLCFDGALREDPPQVRFTETVCGQGGRPAPLLALVVLVGLVRRVRRTARADSVAAHPPPFADIH